MPDQINRKENATAVLAQSKQGSGWSEGPLSKAAANLGNAGDIKKWWPSPWGTDDEAGASNWITPEKVRDAIELIEEGKIYELGRVYEPGMPFATVVPRGYRLTIEGAPSFGPFGENNLIGHIEFVAGDIGQVGTQLDGIGHIGIQMGGQGTRTKCCTTTASPGLR
jgi:hypothetical protein